jgi:hypothetical protein
LNPAFTKLWNLDLPSELTTASEPGFHVLGPSTVAFGPARWSIHFDLQGTTSGIHDFQHLLKRVVCFMLLTRLPNEGLAEVISTLRDAIDFYRQPGDNVQHQLPTPGRSAVRGKTLERAPLVLDEEG